MTFCRLLSLVAAVNVLSLTPSYFEESFNSRERSEPVVLALELGTMGGSPTHQLPQRRLGGDSERVFGPVHPRQLGRYTGKNLGSYTGGGLGSYNGSGLGGSTTFGTGNAINGQGADERFR